MISMILEKLGRILSPIAISLKKAKYKQRLKNKDFTILCSNCIGGIIYNRLDHNFLSPTINMWETQRDFIKLALNPEFYLAQDLVFIDTDESTPVAKLGDITLHFNHHTNNNDAARDWNRRKARVNLDNLYVIFYYRDGYTIEEIRQIENAKCKNYVVLTDKPLDLPYAVRITPNLDRPNGDSFLDKDWLSIRTFEKQWDFVEWLNTSII